LDSFRDFGKNSFFLFLEFFSRYCYPSGEWSNMSFASCFYPDILALLNKSYSARPPEERVVCRILLILIEFV